MAKAFSVASWNVEHFNGKPERIADVAAFLLSVLLSCNNPQDATEIATEKWRINKPQTQNHADITLHSNDDALHVAIEDEA